MTVTVFYHIYTATGVVASSITIPAAQIMYNHYIGVFLSLDGGITYVFAPWSSIDYIQASVGTTGLPM